MLIALNVDERLVTDCSADESGALSEGNKKNERKSVADTIMRREPCLVIETTVAGQLIADGYCLRNRSEESKASVA